MASVSSVFGELIQNCPTVCADVDKASSESLMKYCFPPVEDQKLGFLRVLKSVSDELVLTVRQDMPALDWSLYTISRIRMTEDGKRLYINAPLNSQIITIEEGPLLPQLILFMKNKGIFLVNEDPQFADLVLRCVWNVESIHTFFSKAPYNLTLLQENEDFLKVYFCRIYGGLTDNLSKQCMLGLDATGLVLVIYTPPEYQGGNSQIVRVPVRIAKDFQSFCIDDDGEIYSLEDGKNWETTLQKLADRRDCLVHVCQKDTTKPAGYSYIIYSPQS
jgi:hypothetical protein